MAASSSLEVRPPLQRIRMAASTLSPARPQANNPARAAALPAASFRPRRFYDLGGLLRNPSPSRFPGTTLMGFGSPSRDSPASRGPLRLRRDLPLLSLMPGPAFAVAFASTSTPALQGFAPRGDRRRSRSVSLAQGLVSLLGFSGWDLAPSACRAPRRGLDLVPLRELARQRLAPPPEGGFALLSLLRRAADCLRASAPRRVRMPDDCPASIRRPPKGAPAQPARRRAAHLHPKVALAGDLTPAPSVPARGRLRSRPRPKAAGVSPLESGSAEWWWRLPRTARRLPVVRSPVGAPVRTGRPVPSRVPSCERAPRPAR